MNLYLLCFVFVWLIVLHYALEPGIRSNARGPASFSNWFAFDLMQVGDKINRLSPGDDNCLKVNSPFSSLIQFARVFLKQGCCLRGIPFAESIQCLF